jgi:hypothetical protein
MLNFGLFFETALACFLCYTPYLDKGLNMYPLKYVENRKNYLFNLINLDFDGGYLLCHFH